MKGDWLYGDTVSNGVRVLRLATAASVAWAESKFCASQLLWKGNSWNHKIININIETELYKFFSRWKIVFTVIL